MAEQVVFVAGLPGLAVFHLLPAGPEVLGDLTAADRYALWCKINDGSPETVHTEIICTGPIQAQHFPEKGEFHLNGAQQSFAQRYGLDQAEMKNALWKVQAIRHVHLCSSLKEMLLEENEQVRQCRRCRKYFLVKGNYPSLCCTRTAEGSTQTCQQLAAASAFHSKRKDNAWACTANTSSAAAPESNAAP